MVEGLLSTLLTGESMSYKALTPVYESKLSKAFKKLSQKELEGKLKNSIYTHSKNVMSFSMTGMLNSDLSEFDPYIEWTKSIVATDELYWNQQGRQVIFIESKEFVDAILSSKFDVDVVKNLKPLSDSFQLVLPKGCTDQDGNELPNVLVNWFKTAQESMDVTTSINRESYIANGDIYENFAEVQENLQQVMNIGQKEVDQIMNKMVDNKDEGYHPEEYQILNLTMTYEDPETPIAVKSIYEHKFAEALSGDVKKESDRVINTVLKLILGLTIYVNAGGHIREGFPTKKAATTKARKSLDKAANGGFKVKFISFAKEMKASSGGFVRGFHFRNLKAERYYQGEHANEPKGSRWVFVSPSWVGGKVKPKTAYL